MFKAVIARAGGTPWPATGMTTDKWLERPTIVVRIKDLIAMQDGIYFHALHKDHDHGRDPLPHVVKYNGDLYLEDGHHRAVKARLRGKKTLVARFLDLDTPS